MLTDLLLLDIETVPQAASFEQLDPDWQQLFRDKISKTVPEGEEPAVLYRKKGGILAEFGKIICISTAFFYYDEKQNRSLKIKSISGNDEKTVLEEFTVLCDRMHRHNRDFRFAGHNIREFDIPYICRRMLVNGLQLPDYLRLHERKPWEVKMFDTLSWWKFGDNKNYISLHLLASVLGIPTSKTDMDGSMVQDVYYKDNDLPRIVEYCQRDVIVTAGVILRFQNQPPLQPEQVTVAG
ncbi:ribonuclease H-like domain-containing protein [Sediminibacterium ginsengisoli]|uniref:Predicted 3'-5' exonuclease PolB-like domain-containing protein n=1 Tax=Sediminibacterium ginsengisoli TaxID=413434 RepID=A0A1T4QP84_9BACT|nr:ribonuclease H-like domain-containing protein [Sediminibacterium ginsengisoli]SKA05570.1 hypothetical protein SAMN04488132_1099 [Sediminibacterium ginsengisoli]